METKTRIRKETLCKRSALSFLEQKEKSDSVMGWLIGMDVFKNADLILLYKDYKNEVMTDAIFYASVSKQKKVAYPKVNGDDMDFYMVESLDRLKEGYKGIFEPDDTCRVVIAEDIVDKNVLMLLPGAAFDKYGNRIGYGKGFYDRYLNKIPVSHTAALSYSLQLVEEIPSEEHDKTVDFIITENEIILCKGK